jgi:hypothetical protein
VEHVAIDLGGRESQVCVRNTEGSIIEQIGQHWRLGEPRA